LIDLGLATVTPPVGSGKRSVTEMALIKSLADREKHVREAAPPVGIWGLRDPLKPPAGK
jgi:type II secretory ATPase GspE/PulE/Tfp pilus assembly ATPase PilB-like protein